MKLTSRYPFSASHRLHSEKLSEEQNQSTYGKCNNPFGHGHNYVIEVTVSGEPNHETGMIVERAKLDRAVEEELLLHIRHRNLNYEVPELASAVPTTENVAYVFTRILKNGWSRHFQGAEIELNRVRIHETRNNRFEIEANEIKQ